MTDPTWSRPKPTGADTTAPQVAWLRRNPALRIVFEQDGVLVFERVLPP